MAALHLAIESSLRGRTLVDIGADGEVTRSVMLRGECHFESMPTKSQGTAKGESLITFIFGISTEFFVL